MKLRTNYSAWLACFLFVISIPSPAANVATEPGNSCVILLHGLARTSASMNKMQRALEDSGYYVANIDYPSRHLSIEQLAPIAVRDGLDECNANSSVETVHFVTHSLGGILVRYYLESNDIEDLGRVVMIGPPNQGSNAADVLRGLPGLDWINGPAGAQLGKGPDSVPLQLGRADFDVGIIAGNRTIDPVTSSVLNNPDDGKVAVEDTKLEGMADFRLVGSSHAFIMKRTDVIEYVRNFLENGDFGE